MTKNPTITKGDLVDLEVEKLAFGGQAVTRHGDFIVFIDGALPGQKVRARIVKKKKNHAVAKTTEILRQSPAWVTPACAHFDNCGGCTFQHLAYEEQLRNKQQQVVETLQRLGGLDGFRILPAIPSPDVFYYRNKMEFTFSRHRWLTEDEIASSASLQKHGLFLGLHARGFFDKIVDVHDCRLLAPFANDILRTVRAFAQESGLPAFSTHDHTGFWRFVVIRHAKFTNEIMVNLIASEFDGKIADSFRALMTQKHPEISSLIYGVTKSKANVAFTEGETLLAGKSVITEKIGEYGFEISPNSFFQTNTRGAQKLYDAIMDFAGFKANDNVYDLYSGAGTIAIYASKRVGNVTCFEAIPAAVNDAKRNAELNQVKNCTFILGDLKDALAETESVMQKYGKPDVIIIDPPRSGMHPRTVQAVLNLLPGKIIHVSCNPATLARDLKILCEKDYALSKIQAVDMFPHTAHIEVVAQVLRKW